MFMFDDLPIVVDIDLPWSLLITATYTVMTSKNYNGAPPKYLNDFSKALAAEVRILLDEVGKLRDERRALQFEIAELMAVKSKHGGGGEYAPDWHPKAIQGPEEPAAEAPPPPPPEEASSARPGWRVVHKRPDRKDRAPKTPKALPAPSPAAPPMEVPRPNMPSWAQWRPNPHFAPPTAAPSSPAPQSPAPRAGLFGPDD